MKEEKISEKQNKKQQYDWLKPYMWKKGESGNPNGRPPGKSLKTYLREYFEDLTDDEKAEFFKHINPELAWRMAEGNPQNDITSDGKPIVANVNVSINDFTDDEDTNAGPTSK